METNTVNLNLKTYNRLRDFEKNMIENNTININWYDSNDEYRHGWYFSQSEVAKSFADKNQSLVAKINELEKQLAGEPKEIMLKDVKTMSIWQFIKWKRNG